MNSDTINMSNDKEKMSNDKDYVVVTAISSYRMRYVMHRDDLQKLNFEVPVDSVEWANDSVSSEECDEFSQKHMGEYIVDSVEMNEDDMLDLFDKDNDYLSAWTKEQKLELVRKSILNKTDWGWEAPENNGD